MCAAAQDMTVGTREQLAEFLRQNRDAWQLAWKAREDYKLARIGMACGAWSAFEMGEQAVEKLLKSYVVFKEPEVKLKALGHDTTACLDAALRHGLAATDELVRTAERLRDLYRRRYPGTPDTPRSLSTGEMHDLDRAMFEIWDNFEPLQPDYYYVSGLLVDLYGARLQPSASAEAQAGYLTRANDAYATRRHRLHAGIDLRLAAWYGMAVQPDGAGG
ncbi:MAG: hypothetical protein SangKO_067540 [Sandaracinaceae bacterium]